MRRSAAKARLKRMVAWDQMPALTESDLEDLLALARRADSSGHAIDAYDVWEPATAYRVGDRVIPSVANGHAYVCIVAGASGTDEPSFPAGAGATVVDGTVTWREDGAALWTPTYDLNLAAAEGWRWKAAKAASLTGFTADGATFHEEQIVAHCLGMAARYAAGVVASVTV